MAGDEPSIETLGDELEQVYARHNEVFRENPERALSVALQFLDERRLAHGVDVTVEPLEEHDCAAVRFGDRHTAMLGVRERTMSHFEEIREAIQDQYGHDSVMETAQGKTVVPGVQQ